jgi:protein tyrosine/serine phosphatase
MKTKTTTPHFFFSIRFSKIFLAAVLILGMSLWANSEKWAQPVDNSPLENFHQLSDSVFRSAQPDDKDFRWLEENGYLDVLNLRNFHDDEDEAEGTRVRLHHVAINAHTIDEDEVIQALKIIHHADSKIVFHCWHGSDRTGTIAAFYRIIFQGWTKEEALEELKEGGFGFHSIYFNIPRMIKKANIERMKQEVFQTFTDSLNSGN